MNEIWNRCLDLAIEAIINGSLGISAVITDNDKIISEGRNQLFDNVESVNRIIGTVVSHAEINCLAGLPEKYKNDKTVTLYTTVEPCPMCIGAITMSSVRNVVIATKDDWAGSVNLTKLSPYISRKKINIEYADSSIERIFSLTNLVSIFVNHERVTRGHKFIKIMAQKYSEAVQKAADLKENRNFINFIRDKNRKEIKKILQEF